jgi:hypothetical protein
MTRQELITKITIMNTFLNNIKDSATDKEFRLALKNTLRDIRKEIETITTD